MSSAGLLFVISPEADAKAVNRALMHLRDREFESGDRFHVVQSRNAFELDPPESDPERMLDETEPGSLDDTNYNAAWAGTSLEDVEAFARDLNKTPGINGEPGCHFLVLDDQGLQEKTVIVMSYRLSDDDDDDDDDDGDEGEKWDGEYDKVRVPWDEAYGMWCNLDIANMDFEDFCEDEDPPESPPYWWTYHSVSGPPEQEIVEQRDREIRELEEQDKI